MKATQQMLLPDIVGISYIRDKESRNNGQLFVLNHLAKCQTYFMLAYSAYASVCQVSLRFVCVGFIWFYFSVLVQLFGLYLLLGEFEFERQTLGRCTVVNSFVKRCAHKICALFMALNVELNCKSSQHTHTHKRGGLDLDTGLRTCQLQRRTSKGRD